ncbi:MAG: DinB family protein [Bacteroidetes bacterium]|nr:DinB family protein [Bacteroidota bacterium]
MNIKQITSAEYAAYYAPILHTVSDEYSLLEELEISVHRLIKFVQNIPMDKFDYRYAEGKWTIKDILLHLIDAERIFAYRALRFARRDRIPLASFDEDAYVISAGANQRNIQDLLSELATVRQATLALFKTFSDDDLLQIGQASGQPMSVRALGFVIIGHQNHHQKIFQERYLNQ